MNQKKVYMIFIFVLMLFPMMILAKDTVLIARGFVIQINAKIMFRNNVR